MLIWRYVLFWLAGVDLRVTLLAVPPVLPLIHHDLRLDEKTVAAITGLPVLLLGIGAIPGSLLISRMGARRALLAGLVLVALASALRGVGPSLPLLSVMTLLMGVGIAAIQPAFPSLVGQWFSSAVGFATAVYANGLVAGELIAAAITLPVILPLVAGSWGSSFVVWGAFVLLTAVLIAVSNPHVPRDRSRPRALWWPNWRDAQTWKFGILQCGISSIYFGANTFIPDYLHAVGKADLVGPSLTALNGAQLPASFLVLGIAKKVAGHKAPFVVAGFLALGGLALLLAANSLTILAGSAIIGFAGALALILTLALPPLLAPPHDVHRVSAGMFTIGYTLAFFVPLIGGAAWDATRIAATAFLPVAIGSLVLIGGALSLRTTATRSSPDAAEAC